jgi:high-affinity Fe2+/Pb2+ permease
MQFHVQGRPGILGWVRIVAALAVLLAVVVAIAIVALGVFLFLLPALLIATIVSYFVLRSRLRRAQAWHARDAKIIDGEYSVVDPDEDQKSLTDRTPRED